MTIFAFSVSGLAAPGSPGAQIEGLEPEDPYGVDFKSYPDLTVTPISGPRVVAEALYRRFSTERGSNPFHPNDGLDLRAFLNDSVTNEALSSLKSAIEREAAKDERVLGIAVGLDFDFTTSELEVEFIITLADGPFRMTMVVSSLTTELLLGEVS